MIQGLHLNQKSLILTMASYAAIVNTVPASTGSTVASPTFSRGAETELQANIKEIMAQLSKVTTTPDGLITLLDSLRGEMEGPPQRPGNRFGNTTNFGGASTGGFNQRSFQGSSWRSGGAQSASPRGRASAFDTRSQTIRPPPTNPKPVGRYQTRFKTEGDLNDKILNTVIGNKLNSFTATTYNDTRDFIYQIMDSGETEFIKDFIEKVFSKATVEELYCALFAKLIAEIAHRYPIMYEEMKRYHQEFLNVFDQVDDGKVIDSDLSIRRRLYRLGYGQFISELACNDALEKEQLIAMVSKVMDKIWEFTCLDEKVKVVEEFIDCLVRLTKSLVQKSPEFFKKVKGDMAASILERAQGLINKTAGSRPSLSTKAKFGLMDLKDLL
jgi:hypothetical protein